MRRLTPLLALVALLVVPQTLAAQDDSANAVGITGTIQAGPSLFFDTLGGGVTMRHYVDNSIINILDFSLGTAVKF